MAIFSVISPPWGLVCQLLLIAVVAFLVGGFALNRYNPERLGRMPTGTELPQSALVIGVSAVVWATAARSTPLSTCGVLVCAGMAFGFAGDMFMADIFHQKNHVLFGMAVFAIGHLLYVLAFREIAVHFALHDLSRYGLALLITWCAALILWFVLVRKPGSGMMQIAALIYALFLASMAGYAFGLALQQDTFYATAIGAVLFLLSDTLIGARLFSGRTFPYMGDLIWGTYIVGQALIVLVVPIALSLR